MENKTQKYAGEVTQVLSGAWTAAAVTAGINTGIFDMMNEVNPVTIEEIAQKLDYDVAKLKRWFGYLESVGIVLKWYDGYVITPKGVMFTPKSPLKDLAGFVQINDFFMKASSNAKVTFKRDRSLDKLTEGEITRVYQPKVSDNFSMELGKCLKTAGANSNDNVLDVGCGNGSFLRTLYREEPSLDLSGVDLNAYAIDYGIRQNIALGINDKIKLIVADITAHDFMFNDNSYDWVTGVNIFHFIDEDKRLSVIDNMIRIAKKGVLLTQVTMEEESLAAAANPLMSLLWNDFTGFYDKSELETFNAGLKDKYPKCNFKSSQIMLGNSNLLTIMKE